MFAQHNLLTYATAIALQLLVAMVALAFLALALLRPLGQQTLWLHTVVPVLAAHLPLRWLLAVSWSVHREMSSDGVSLIVFAALLAVWEVSGSVRAVMSALNRIYGVTEPRGTVHRFALSFALALALTVLLVAAVLIGAGAFAVPSTAAAAVQRVIVPALIVYAVIAMLVLVAPAQRQPWRWVSVGSIGIVLIWLAVSAAFSLWIGQVVNLRTPEGMLALFLATVSYLYVSAIAFLIGAGVDQLIREGGVQALLGNRRSMIDSTPPRA
jgi:membrane protein